MVLYLRRYIRKLKDFLGDVKRGNYSYFFLIFPINNKKIVISNYYGKGYGDNGKYIVEEILSQNLNYDIVWLLNKELFSNSNLPTGVRAVKYGSIRGLYELATAKVWIDNSRKHFYPPKRKEQFYIQTWHGGLGVKSVEKDAEDKLPPSYVRTAKKDAKITDLMISNGRYITELFRSSFWYDGEILECGFPRNDILIQNTVEMKDKILRKLNLKSDTKYLLYAPTFRNNTSIKDYLFDFDAVREKMADKFGGLWVILLRLHPNISNMSNEIEYSDVLINATKYDDLQELLLISDAFMTDFSSCLSDFFLLKRPIFLYCTNYNEYINERGFNTDIRSLGFPLAENNEELLRNIEEFDIKECNQAIEYNFERLGYRFNGFASKDVVKIIESHCN